MPEGLPQWVEKRGLANGSKSPSWLCCCLEELVMSDDITDLEQEWLQAETLADKARYEAEVYEAKKNAARDEGEIMILATNIEKARARHARAEQMACETFDRLWQAKSQGQMNA
jgi:hypothetical protein